MHDEWMSHLCVVQAPLQIIQVSLRSHKLSPQGPADFIDSFTNTLKVGMLALARRPQQTQQLQAKAQPTFHGIFAYSMTAEHDSQAQRLIPGTSNDRIITIITRHSS